MNKLTKKEKHARVLNALLVLVFTEATYAWLYANDPQALKQALEAITLGDIDAPKAEFLGRMRAKYGPVDGGTFSSVLWVFRFTDGGFNQVSAQGMATAEEVINAARAHLGDEWADKIDRTSIRGLYTREERDAYYRAMPSIF